MIVGGMERVYEVGRIFRNEGIDLFHNPEFTTVEAYQAFGDLSDMMNLTEDLIRTLALKVRGTTKIHFNGADIDVGPEFRRANMTDLIKEKLVLISMRFIPMKKLWNWRRNSMFLPNHTSVMDM